MSLFAEGEKESGGSNGLGFVRVFCREETFVQHKYAVDPSSIFPNLFSCGCYRKQFLIGRKNS